MSRLRIYSGGTGNLQYDSGDSSKDGKSTQAKREFNGGVLLLYAPQGNEIHGYVKLHRGAEEQFLAVYENTGGDLVTEFNSAIRKAVNERNWKIVPANQVNQSVFENLGTQEQTEPNVSLEEIKQELQQQGTIDFIAGDAETAVQLFEYLRRNLPDLSIAVTTSGRTDPIQNTNVVIKIDKSYQHSQPSVAAESAKRLHNANIEADKKALESQLAQLSDALNGSTRGIVGQQIAKHLNSTGFRDEYGLHLRGEQAPAGDKELALRWAISSVSIISIIGIILFVGRVLQEPNINLEQTVTLFPSGSTNSISTIAAGQFLLLEGLFLTIVLFSFRKPRRLTKYLLAPLLSLLPDGRTSSRRGSRTPQQIRAVTEQLDQLRSRTTNDDRFIREITDSFSQFGVKVTREEAIAKNQNGQRLLGLGIGVLVGISITAIGVFLTQQLLPTIGSNLEWVISAGVSLIVVLGLIRILLWLLPRRSSTHSMQQNSQRPFSPSPGPASQNTRSHPQHTHPSNTTGDQTSSAASNSRTANKPGSHQSPNSETSSSRRNSNADKSSNGGRDYNSTMSPSTDSSRQSGNTSGAKNEGPPTTTPKKSEDVSQDDDINEILGEYSKESSIHLNTDTQDDSDETEPAGQKGNENRESGDSLGEKGTSDSPAESSTRGFLEYLGPESMEYPGGEFRSQHYDQFNTGHHPGVEGCISDSPTSQWKRSVSGGQVAPIVVSQGEILLASQYTLLMIGLDSNTVVDQYNLQGRIIGSPLITPENVFVGTDEGHVYSINREDNEGRPLDKLGGAITASPKMVGNAIIAASTNGTVREFSKGSGRLLWEYTLKSGVEASPAVTSRGSYFNTKDGEVVALHVSPNKDTGNRKLWSCDVNSSSDSSPIVVDDEVYIAGQGVYGIDTRAGTTNWNELNDRFIPSTPAVAGETLFFGDGEGTFYAFNRTTREVNWSTSLNTTITCSPTIAGQHVFVGDDAGDLHSLDARSGEEVWTYEEADGAVQGAPIVIDENICFTTETGELHVLTNQNAESEKFTYPADSDR